MSNNENLLDIQCVCKQFSGIPVLKEVAMDIRHGEIHALMGENGAGKSTLVKIIAGYYEMDSGQIYMDGKPVSIRSRYDSNACGISVIYQELSLIPALTVTQNIFLGHEFTRFGFSCKKKMRRVVQSLIDKYCFDIHPDAIIGSLSMAKRQMVEILKALSTDAKLIIMDEPTSSLSTEESEKLFETIISLKNKGTSILYISHRLDEVYKLADRLTVMRDGKRVGVLPHGEISPKTVIPLMIGKELTDSQKRYSPPNRSGMNCLEVDGLAYSNILTNIGFKAYGGEILGISGLVGSGRTELIKCIYGILRQRTGTVLLNGSPVSRSVAKNISAGFAFVPEDRHQEGLFSSLSIEKNLTAASLDILSFLTWIRRSKEIRIACDAIKTYDIRPSISSIPVGNLSGGNQQKVVVGRWLSRKPKVLLLDEPTVGIDVGVKDELYKLIRELAAAGTIVILVTSDYAELTYLSDRILVIHDGSIIQEFIGGNVRQTDILMAASGVKVEEVNSV